jgi:hypothetical protein
MMSSQWPRVRPDGGRVAARGFQYQYLRTLEYLLDHIDDPQVASVRVEGPPPTQSGHADAIDFDVLDIDGRCLLAAQVKSKAPGRLFSSSDAFSAVVQLILTGDASSYCLLTNGQPSPIARQLAQLLSAPGEPTQLREKLKGLLSDSPARLAQLEALSIIEVERLVRCRVLFDERDDVEIREILRERLRAFRNKVRSGLGQQSAGMLTGYIVSEILRRAADVKDAIFTVDQLRSQLLVSADDLARVSGVRDWGVIIGVLPYVPDVARPALLSTLIEALSGPRDNNVRRSALVGPSGIGKSSLAAAYIADRADSYDWIFWIDCETEESIVTSFRSIATFLHVDDVDVNYNTSPVYLCQSVHTELSRISGQWLIVFDNVADLRQTETWIPRAGSGHIIVTSIDSAARHGSATVIDVGVMDQSEAIELLCRRLKIPDGDRQPYDQELRSLAEGLSCWPLALELASGYIDACGIHLADVSHYLNQLKVRSLADPASLPPIYPRTLVAAVSLCLERLNERIGEGGRTGGQAFMASGMVTFAAFLASRQLPCHLLAAAVAFDPEDDTGPRVWIVDPSIANIGEAVRELRRFSLVNFDQDLPVMGNEILDISRTMTINTVVQEIIRSEIENDPDTHGALNRLANHVERWLTQALELNYLERASALFPHADMLSDHMRRLRVVGRQTALLYGNLAGAYRARGEIHKAEELLRAELDLTEGEDPNDILVIQTKLQLADICFNIPDTASTSIATAISYLEDVARHAADISSTYPEAAMFLVSVAKNTLDREQALVVGSPKLLNIKSTFDELAVQIGPTEYSEALLAIHKANKLITKGRLETAERLCYRALDSGAITGDMELQARRLLVEALARQRKWQEAQGANYTFRQHFGSARIHLHVITEYAHNVGNACATVVLAEGGTDAADASQLLGDILAWPVISETIKQPSPGWNARLRLLAGILDLVQGDYRQAEATITSMRPIDLREGTPEETRGWCLLWQNARLAAFRGTSSQYMQSVE